MTTKKFSIYYYQCENTLKKECTTYRNLFYSIYISIHLLIERKPNNLIKYCKTTN